MQQHITHSADSATYAEEYPPPPPLPSSSDSRPVGGQSEGTNDVTLGPIALMANILITIIIIAAMMVDGSQARTAIIAGSAYFAMSTFAFAVVTTGTLTAIVNAYQRERSERQRVAAYLALGTMALRWRMEVERNRFQEHDSVYPSLEVRTPPVGSVERVSPLTTFVAPYADEAQAAREGVAWAERLYDRSALGAPDPRRVHPDGRLKVRMIGSKRGGGSREAGIWLLQRGVMNRVTGGYALNLNEFPYRHYVSALARKIA